MSVECSIEAIKDPFALVIFGASGDLTKRKLVPAVFRLYRTGLLPKRFSIIGAARSPLSDAEFRGELREFLGESEDFDRGEWDDFSARLHYVNISYDDIESFRGLAARVHELREKAGAVGTIYYLATPPELYSPVISNLGGSGMASPESRIIVEKPFGSDLESARTLNRLLHVHFAEDRIYRIDHYLAKETVQNILLFRFANSIFEPLWNRSHVDHVQITVAESIGVGQRAGYYDRSGVLKDMFQNHMLQLLSLVAMEPPNLFRADQVRDEKVKIFQAIRPIDGAAVGENIVLGQYTRGEVDGRPAKAYLEEEGIPEDSATPTYVAGRIFVDNWRWEGVPFYLRTGKRLPRKSSRISIHFRDAPHRMFKELPLRVLPNVLTFVIQPEEAIILRFEAKIPGSKVCIKEWDMRFSYGEEYTSMHLEAYERVLVDCFSAEQMLFVRQDDAEAAWKFLTPVLEAAREGRSGPLSPCDYPAGTWGPGEARALIARDGREWMLD